MALSLASLGIYVTFKNAREESLVVDDVATTEPTFQFELGWIPLVCLMSFITAYSIGFGAVPQLVMGELFPQEYRHRLGTISTSFNLCCTFLVVKTFPDMVNVMGLANVYLLYSSFCFLGLFFVGFFLPETKGKTLEEISQLFNRTPSPNNAGHNGEEACAQDSP